MRHSLSALLLLLSLTACADKAPDTPPLCTPAQQEQCPPESTLENAPTLKPDDTLVIRVVGQGVAPADTTSPAQAYALAKRAAIADAYRLLAEKVKGVHVEGEDLVKEMMVKRSTLRTRVDAMVCSATPVETTFKEGLCEVEMELPLSYSQFAR